MSENQNPLVLATDKLLLQYPKPEIRNVTINTREDLNSEMEYIKELKLYEGSVKKGMDTILNPSIEKLENLKREVKTTKEKIDTAKNYISSRLGLEDVESKIKEVRASIESFQTKERQELARQKAEADAKAREEIARIEAERLAKATSSEEEEMIKSVGAIVRNEAEIQHSMDFKHQATIKDDTGFKISTRKQWKLDEDSIDMLEYIKWVVQNPEYINTLSLNKSKCNENFKPTEAKPNPVKPNGINYVETTSVSI